MDPFTHLMTGACLARAGFNRKAAYAAVAMTIAAELPDIDTLWSIRGPIASFQHHRGWTHTFLGLPLEAAALVGILYLYHRRKTQKQPYAKPLAAPVRWPLLFAFTLIALLSHLALDWTNNYGLRPFFPFNPRWYAGSIVFIFEPVIFAMLLGALIVPSLFSLINSEVGAKRTPFRGRGWAIAALLGVAALWTLREVEKNKALQLVGQENFTDTQGLSTQIQRVNINPHPINPFEWHAVLETPTYYQLATIDTLSGTITANPADIFYKPPTTIATLIAKRSWLGEVYLDWSQIPLVTELPKSTDPEDQGLTTVSFRDLRFMYDVPFLPGRERSPLSGSVIINEDRKVVRMELNGSVQK